MGNQEVHPRYPIVWQYLTAVFLVSIPFWVFGAWFDGQFLPGLPVSSLMIICPIAVAAAFILKDQGWDELATFLTRAFDGHKLKAWGWFVALLTMPAVMGLSALWMAVFGDGVPPPQIDPLQAVLLLGVFFVAATAEEMGWTGYATGPLVKTYGIIPAGLILGLLAAFWHVFPLLQADRALDWIAWWFLGTISRRVLIVWAYHKGGQSVFGASLLHTMSNFSWMMFPVMGSHYDPMITSCIMVSVTVVTLTIDRASLTHC